MNQSPCSLCPRNCQTDRRHTMGFCQCGLQIRAAKAALHHWEEPCISGTKGSGTIFFCGCTLHCVFCQNHEISQQHFGRELTVSQLSRIMRKLQDQGAHNINLVTPTPYLPQIMEALETIKDCLQIPVVYNTGGYEKPSTLQALSDYVSVFLPDLKYHSSLISSKYSAASDYFQVASRAVLQMVAMTGPPQLDSQGLMQSGTIIRHLVLPGQYRDSITLLNWMAQNLPKGDFYISLLSQYTPCYQSHLYPEINRTITTYEYQKVVDQALNLDLTLGYVQEKSSATTAYTPPFDLEGIQIETSIDD